MEQSSVYFPFFQFLKSVDSIPNISTFDWKLDNINIKKNLQINSFIQHSGITGLIFNRIF